MDNYNQSKKGYRLFNLYDLCHNKKREKGRKSMSDIYQDALRMHEKTKYKVYIIDEVHMLSQGAFNALLKTLEEPPSYVIFILSTTEPHKIPATILSRCCIYFYYIHDVII